MDINTRQLRAVLLVPLIIGLSGCASIAKGVTEAVMASGEDDKEEDRGQCSVRGRPFDGLEAYLQRQERWTAGGAADRRPVLKILMVHGIGIHVPGYSTRLQENLARALDLDVTAEDFKEINLDQQSVPGDNLGTLRVHRYLNRNDTRTLLFYELTWSNITKDDKNAIAYDTSGEYSFRRASINQTIKEFSNSHLPDPLIYLGKSQAAIQASVGQAACWMLSHDWDRFPSKGKSPCNPAADRFLDYLGDDYAIISHSLGSRIVVDSMPGLAMRAHQVLASASLNHRSQRLREKTIPVFMLANQLPLLQLGLKTPEVRRQITDYCDAGGAKHSERLLSRLRIVAFSDPNDILSYAVPPRYADNHIDSRVCPSLDNVIINVTKVADIFGVGEFANPSEAHSAYDNDQRVIALIAKGIGNRAADPMVQKDCEWLETR